ncbi:MAG: hypothetical protein AAF614_31315 [Chloroflexota bacterium]
MNASNDMTNKDKATILYDHYKDSFAQQLESLRRRERIFYILLLVLGVALFQIGSPAQTEDVISAIISKQAGTDIGVSLEIASSILWFAILSLVVRYFQIVVYVERQYKYIHHLEAKLSTLLGEKDFISREGTFYFQNYTSLSKWIWRLYTVVFPLFLIFVIGGRIGIELQQTQTWTIASIANFSIFVLLIIIIAEYLYQLHFTKRLVSSSIS